MKRLFNKIQSKFYNNNSFNNSVLLNELRENSIINLSGFIKKDSLIIVDETGESKANRVIPESRNTLQILFIYPLKNTLNILFKYGTYLN